MDDPQAYQPWLPGQPPPWLGPVAPDGTPLESPVAAVEPAANATQGAPDPTAAAPAPVADMPITSPSQVDAAPVVAPAAAPAPMVTDAVSGVAPVNPHLAYLPAFEAPHVAGLQPADEHAAVVAANPQNPLEDRSKALEDSTMTPAQRAQVMARMSPEDLAALNITEQQRKIHEQAAQQLEASRLNAEREAQNNQDYQAAIARAKADSAQVQADAARLANTHIDPQIHGVGNAILALVTSTIGGLASPHTGGQNLALNNLNKQIELHIQAQKDNIANGWQGVNTRRNAIAQELQTHGDAYRAQEAFRVATYDRALSDIQTKMQDFDPAGTTALKMADASQQIAAQRAAAIQAYTEKKLKDNLEAAKSEREDAQAAEVARHNKAEEGIAWAKEAREGAAAKAAKADQQVFSVPELQALHPGMPVPPVGMSLKDYGGWLERTQKGAELAGKKVENDQKVAGSIIRNPVTGDAMTVDGKPNSAPITAPADVAKDVNDKSTAAQQYLDAMSEVRRAIEAGPSVIDRNQWQSIQTKVELAKTGMIKYMGAKPSSREMQVADEVVGADFNSYFSRIKDKGRAVASMDALIDGVKRDTGTELKKAGYKGPSPLLDTSKPTAPKETDATKTTASLTENVAAKDPESLDAADRAYVIARQAAIPPEALATEASRKLASRNTEKFGADADTLADPEVQRAMVVGIPPSQLRTLDSLYADAMGANESRKQAALKLLNEQAHSNENGAIRKYAADVIQATGLDFSGIKGAE